MSYEKVSGSLPLVGGIAVGATEGLLSFGDIIHTAALAAVGALAGYLVKIGMDLLMAKIKNRNV